MTDEQQELITSIYHHLHTYYKEEVNKCWDIAQKLDTLNPELEGAFTGSPSLRIERQLYAIGILE
jgi:hypothetical protein